MLGEVKVFVFFAFLWMNFKDNASAASFLQVRSSHVTVRARYEYFGARPISRNSR